MSVALRIDSAALWWGSSFIFRSAAQTAEFGVPLSIAGEPKPSRAHYGLSTIAGLRTAAYGGLIITLALLGERKALGVTTAFLTAIAFGDVAAVFLYGDPAKKSTQTIPHLVAGVLIGWLSYTLLE